MQPQANYYDLLQVTTGRFYTATGQLNQGGILLQLTLRNVDTASETTIDIVVNRSQVVDLTHSIAITASKVWGGRITALEKD